MQSENQHYALRQELYNLVRTIAADSPNAQLLGNVLLNAAEQYHGDSERLNKELTAGLLGITCLSLTQKADLLDGALITIQKKLRPKVRTVGQEY